MRINNRGFIQLPLLLIILAGIAIIGGGSYFAVKEVKKAPAENHNQQTSIQPQQNTSSTAEQNIKQDVSVIPKPTAQTQSQQQSQPNQPKQQIQPTQTSNTQQSQPTQTAPTQTTPTPQPPQSSENQTQSTLFKVSITLGTQNVDETTARIEWTTSEQTESKLYLSGGGLSSQQHDSQNGYATTHAIMLSNLQSATDYSFQITATGNNGFVDYTGNFKTKTPAPTLELLPTDGSKIALESTGNKLTWTSTYTKSCTASGDWSDSKATSGEYPLSYSQVGNYTYALNCVGDNGKSISKSISINVIDTKPKITFYFNGNAANTYTTNIGSGARMSWEVQYSYGGSCTASGDWNGAKSSNSNQDFVWGAEGNFNYTLTCVNGSTGQQGANTASVTVTQ